MTDIRTAVTTPVAPEARIGIIFFGCLLGIALYLVQRYVGNGLDYIIYEIWIVPVLGFFGLLMFLITDLRDWRPWLATLGYGALVFALTIYVSAQCGLPVESRCSVISFSGFLPSQFIAWFILLFFLQSRFDPAQPGWTYGALLHNSWHNFLTIGLTGLFVGLFWALLFLLASLFNLLGIDFFQRLFARGWFWLPVTGLMTGVGVSMFRSQINAVAIVRRILHASIKILLPLLAFITLLFVLALPFTGLEALWETQRSAMLMMWLIALLLFFTNAVMQEENDALPYARVVRWFVHIAILVSIVLVVLSAYALLLRTGQYGWTVQRLWGLIALVVLGGYVGVYSAGLLVRREAWISWARPGNVVMAAVIAVVLWLVNSPALDLRRMAVASQLARLESGAVAPEDFDFRYLRFNLGKPGRDAIARLSENEELSLTPELESYLMELATADNEGEVSDMPASHDPALLLGRIEVVPAGISVPADLEVLLRSEARSGSADCLSRVYVCLLLEADLSSEVQPEFVLFVFHTQNLGIETAPRTEAGLAYNVVFRWTGGKWQQSGHLLASSGIRYGEIAPVLRSGDFTFPPAERRDLRIGDKKWIWIEEE